MILAKNNIIIKVKDCDEYAILNPISGSFDLMDGREAALLRKVEAGESVDADFARYLLERGYAYPSRGEETAAVARAYEEFRREIEDTQVQLMLIPTYGCNLACAYCYQHGAPTDLTLIKKDTVDAFFAYIGEHFAHARKKPFITLFGGEPLMDAPAQREIISHIVGRCAAEGYELAAVTNGYDFAAYADLLGRAQVKEIQFTLDGSREVHDSRRGMANGGGTFDRIIEGMEAAVERGFPVNLRTVVDLENIGDLVRLAEFLDAKGWLDLPPSLFKTQIGRNYELFECYAKPEHLMTQAALWAEYAAMSRRHPILAKFHRPDFYGVRHIVDTGDMYLASFDTCPAAKTEWVFDPDGGIYGCTASCGRREYQLGTYWPEVSMNTAAVEKWRDRDVLSIEKCTDCRYNVLCGGGCGVVAANAHGGDPLTPDCRPVFELLETGVNHYIGDLRGLSAEESAEAADAAARCSCGEERGDKGGCLICGASLRYASEPRRESCAVCGKEFETNVVCGNGHYVCDACHRSDILTLVEKTLLESSETDPVRLLTTIFRLPGLKMHGPEYHSIVPAVLVAAYQNLNGTREPKDIREAIRRGKDIRGGSCGYHGACGAAVGTGIAVSILEGASPMTNGTRGDTMAAVGRALLALSRFGGPRCCKRDAVASVESLASADPRFAVAVRAKYVCGQYRNNKDCIGTRCPYHPAAGSR
jgi:uncharacterized protein